MKTNGQAKSAASQYSAGERLKIASVAMASNSRLHADSGKQDQPAPELQNPEEVEQLIENWPATSKKAAETTMNFYGPPNEMTPSRLIWFNNRPWKRTVVYRDEVPHDFPVPHADVLEQVINYPVPADKVGEVGLFDKSVIIAQTMGEVSARCDNEAANVLALNMVHEIVSGNKTAEQARETASEQITAWLMNRPAPYADDFQFTLPEEQFQTDEPAIQHDVINQATNKIKDWLSGNKHD